MTWRESSHPPTRKVVGVPPRETPADDSDVTFRYVSHGSNVCTGAARCALAIVDCQGSMSQSEEPVRPTEIRHSEPPAKNLETTVYRHGRLGNLGRP